MAWPPSVPVSRTFAVGHGGALGAGLDRVLLHRVATATVHSLMTHTARALEGTAPAPGEAGAPVWWENGPETAS